MSNVFREDKPQKLDALEFDLTTDRLRIRRFRETDWSDLYEYLSDAEVVKYEPYKPYTESEAREEALRRGTDKDFFAVERLADGKVIGNLYFSSRDFGAMELGYVFNRHAWHHGYATEAAQALMRFCFETTPVPRIVSSCDPENHASWRLLERLGMRRELHGIKDHFFFRDADGTPLWADSYGYAILKEEFLRDKTENAEADIH